MQKKITQLIPFKELLYTDLKILRHEIADKLIDLAIWSVTMLAVTAYVMPKLGLSITYAPFLLAGTCATAGLFEVWPSSVALISDFEGERVITYYLTLPLGAALVFMRAILFYAINGFILGIWVLPLGKLILGSHFDVGAVCFWRFLIIFTITSIFYGAATLWLSSIIPSMSKIGNIWMRVIYPLWFLGCYQYSWKLLHALSAPAAYLNLLNPVTYIMEGMRVALLGQSGYLPFWLSVCMLMFFTVLTSWHAIKRLKIKLDCI